MSTGERTRAAFGPDPVLPEHPPHPKLSLPRVLLALVLIAAVAGSAAYALERRAAPAALRAVSARFAPYDDVTLTPTYPFQTPAANPVQRVVLGFVVGQTSTSCTPSWGSYYTLPKAEAALNLDQRIEEVRRQGGLVTISFGGAANTELASSCTNVSALTNAYMSVLSRYDVAGVDFDIEGAGLDDSAATLRRAQAVAAVQRKLAGEGRHIAVWLTLPATPTGLTSGGISLVRTMLSQHVVVTGVNVLAMDFEATKAVQQHMLTAVTDAVSRAHGQLMSLQRPHTPNASALAWSRLGVTVMIGRNDTPGEIFTPTDARGLVAFVKSHGVAQISIWSINRDSECGTVFAQVGVLSNTCSGVKQTTLEFTHIFLALPGTVTARNGQTAPAWAPPSTAVDNPATSPYPVWQATAAYPAGYKVVWHHAVYQALWFSSGQAPDSPPSGQAPEPWLLLGPVLPGESPQQPTLLARNVNTQWSAKGVYSAGARVLYQGLPFQAKWYSQGVVPQTTLPANAASPWEPLFTLPSEPSS
jgi:chitinase